VVYCKKGGQIVEEGKGEMLRVSEIREREMLFKEMLGLDLNI